MRTILCIGDSNTYGYDPRSLLEDRYEKPWPSLLEEGNDLKVINMGMNGRTIPSGTYQYHILDRQIRSYGEINGIVILLGTNDVLNGIEEISVKMENYLQHISTEFPKAEILLLIPPVITAYGPLIRQRSEELIPVYRKLAERHNCFIADSNDWNLPIAFDGIHFTEEGHKVIAENMKKLPLFT